MYYSVSFNYPGPFSNHCEDEASEASFAAEKKVEQALKAADITFKHQYSYPDGSLYKWISSHLSIDTLKDKIEKALAVQEVQDGDVNVSLNYLYVDDPASDPYKHKKVKGKYVSCKTLAEYMEHKDDV